MAATPEDELEMRKERKHTAQLAKQFVVGALASPPDGLVGDDFIDHCAQEVARIAPHLPAEKFVRNVVKHPNRISRPPREGPLPPRPLPVQNDNFDLPPVVRTSKEYRELFPRYPMTEDGLYAHAFNVDDAEAHRACLDKYGLVVVGGVLSDDECDLSLQAMFDEINSLPPLPQKECDVDPGNPLTWENRNWPSQSKFLVRRPAFARQAFKNRTCETMYKVWRGIFNEKRLRVTIDNWGIQRGTKVDTDGSGELQDKVQWRKHLQPHWDYNPWLWLHEQAQDIDPGYQGLVALTDQSEETGCHVTLPGCTRYLPLYCKEHKKIGMKRISHRPPPTHPICEYMQKIPIRKGDLLVWSWGQLHGNTPNMSTEMRVHQFIRLFPALECQAGENGQYEQHDRYASKKMMSDAAEDPDLHDGMRGGLEGRRGLCMVGSVPWPEESDDDVYL